MRGIRNWLGRRGEEERDAGKSLHDTEPKEAKSVRFGGNNEFGFVQVKHCN